MKSNGYFSGKAPVVWYIVLSQDGSERRKFFLFLCGGCRDVCINLQVIVWLREGGHASSCLQNALLGLVEVEASKDFSWFVLWNMGLVNRCVLSVVRSSAVSAGSSIKKNC